MSPFTKTLDFVQLEIIYIYTYILLAWTCPVNGQIEIGMDDCVGMTANPDWVTGSRNTIGQHDQGT